MWPQMEYQEVLNPPMKKNLVRTLIVLSACAIIFVIIDAAFWWHGDTEYSPELTSEGWSQLVPRMSTELLISYVGHPLRKTPALSPAWIGFNDDPFLYLVNDTGRVLDVKPGPGEKPSPLLPSDWQLRYEKQLIAGEYASKQAVDEEVWSYSKPTGDKNWYAYTVRVKPSANEIVEVVVYHHID